MDDLTELPNIGERVTTLLQTAGITCHAEMADLGSVEVFSRINRGRPVTGYNLLYAIEGAIRKVRWHSIPRHELFRLKEEYDRTCAGPADEGSD